MIASASSVCVDCECGESFERDILDRFKDFTVHCPKCGRQWAHKACERISQKDDIEITSSEACDAFADLEEQRRERNLLRGTWCLYDGGHIRVESNAELNALTEMKVRQLIAIAIGLIDDDYNSQKLAKPLPDSHRL